MNNKPTTKPPTTADEAHAKIQTRFPKMSYVDRMTLYNMFLSVQEASWVRGARAAQKPCKPVTMEAVVQPAKVKYTPKEAHDEQIPF
jgi:hypothetical protein